MSIRVLVCGGRDYRDRDHIWNTLCNIDATRGPISCIIHGAATGADKEGMGWAQCMADSGRAVKHAPYVALWGDIRHPDARIKIDRQGRKYDANAGPRRNQRMLDEGKPDLVVAFPGGSGTRNMVMKARATGVEVIEIAPRSPTEDSQ